MRTTGIVSASFLGWLMVSVAVAQSPTLAIGPRDYGAHVFLDYLDGSDRGVGWHQGARVEVMQRLSLRDGRAELVVRGHTESRGAFLGPNGPHGARTHEADFEHVWSGTARREGRAWLLHFTHTTSTQPARDCDESFRCEPDPEIRGALRCQANRTFGHHGNDRLIPTYLRVPLLLLRGRAIVVDASGSSSGSARVVARPVTPPRR